MRTEVNVADETADSGPCLVPGSIADYVPGSVASSRTVLRPSVLSPRPTRVAGVGGHGGTRPELQVFESSSLDYVVLPVSAGAGLSPSAAEFLPPPPSASRKFFNRPIVTYPLCPPLPPGPEPTERVPQVKGPARDGAAAAHAAMTASFAAAAAESAVKKMDKVLVLMALPGAVDLVNDVRASVHRETTKRVGVHVDRMKVLAGELWDKGRPTTLSSTGQVPDAASASLSLY